VTTSLNWGFVPVNTSQFIETVGSVGMNTNRAHAYRSISLPASATQSIAGFRVAPTSGIAEGSDSTEYFAINFVSTVSPASAFTFYGRSAAGDHTTDVGYQLRLNTNGSISLLDAAGTAQATTSTGLLTTNTWHYFKLETTMHNTTGRLRLYIDGVEEADTGASIDTFAAASSMDQIFVGGAGSGEGNVLVNYVAPFYSTTFAETTYAKVIPGPSFGYTTVESTNTDQGSALNSGTWDNLADGASWPNTSDTVQVSSNNTLCGTYFDQAGVSPDIGGPSVDTGFSETVLSCSVYASLSRTNGSNATLLWRAGRDSTWPGTVNTDYVQSDVSSDLTTDYQTFFIGQDNTNTPSSSPCPSDTENFMFALHKNSSGGRDINAAGVIAFVWYNDASGTTVTRSANLNGSATLASNESITVREAADLNGSATLAAQANVMVRRTAALNGTGDLTATAKVVAKASAALNGSGNLANTAWGITVNKQAALNGTGTLTSAESITARESAALAGSGTLTNNQWNVTINNTANLNGSATLTGSGGLKVVGSAALNGTATVSNGGWAITINKQSSLNGSATLTGAASPTVRGNVALSGSATLNNDRWFLTITGWSADLNGSATLAAVPSAIIREAASLNGTATLTATGQASSGASASLFGSGNLAATASPTLRESAALSGSATLVATATVDTGGGGPDHPPALGKVMHWQAAQFKKFKTTPKWVKKRE
jgi:hypothetical protein